MDYLSESVEFVLTNDPLIHILGNLYCDDLYNFKHVNKFYNTNNRILHEIKLKKELKRQLIMNKLDGVTEDDWDFPFFYKILNLMKYETITNTFVDITLVNPGRAHTYLYWDEELFRSGEFFIKLVTDCNSDIRDYWGNKIVPDIENSIHIYIGKYTIDLQFNKKKKKEISRN